MSIAIVPGNISFLFSSSTLCTILFFTTAMKYLIFSVFRAFPCHATHAPKECLENLQWVMRRRMLTWQIVAVLAVAAGDEQEYRLTRYLLSNYDASVRPADNNSLPLRVTFGISLHHIIDVVSIQITVISIFVLRTLSRTHYVNP